MAYLATGRKVGRPPLDPGEHRVHTHFTISPAALRMVEQLARQEGESKSAVVERAIRRLWHSAPRVGK